MTIEEINLLSNEGKVSIGSPGVKNAKVEAKKYDRKILAKKLEKIYMSLARK